MVNTKISDQDICLRGSGGWVWSRVGERVMGCRWNRWPIRFHPLTIHLSIEEVTIKGCGGEIKQSWDRKLKHTLQEHKFFQSWPTQDVFPCVALVALQFAVAKVSSRQLMAVQFLLQLLLSPQRIASVILLYTFTFYIQFCWFLPSHTDT